STTTTTIIAVREMELFELGRDRTMFREDNNILSNPAGGKKTN
ncbi:hypothetical protein AVEN_144675-1, partial [Araneus ventricosus]